MQAYRLRHRITIQEPTETQDAGSGEMIRDYADLYANCPAEVLTGQGRKMIESGALQNEYDCRINIRWFDITYADLLDCRIIWDGRYYEIISAETDVTARREWRLLCKGGAQVYQAPPITATAVRFLQEPFNGVVDDVFDPAITVEIINAEGNRISSTVDVTLSIGSGTGALTGDTTVAAVAGVATFSDISIDSAGTFTIDADSAGLTGDTSEPFSMTTAAGNSVRFVQQPTNADAGVNFSPTITAEIVDGNGSRVNTTDSISIAIASGSGTLDGVTTVACVAGLATFSNVSIAEAGNYTLIAFADGLGADVSNSIAISRYWLKTSGLNLGIMIIGTANFVAEIDAYIPTNAASFKSLFSYAGGSYFFKVYDADHATKPNDVTITMSDSVELTWAGAFSESRSVAHTFKFARISPTAIELWIDGVSKGTVATTSLIQWRFRSTFYTDSTNTVYGNVKVNALEWLCNDGAGTSCAETGGGAAATFVGAGTWVYGPSPQEAV